MNLDQAVLIHNEMRDRLVAQFPELAEDEDALLDTLEGESNLDRAIVAVWESSEADRLLAKALSDRMDTMAERHARLTQRATAKRDAATKAMEAAGIKKIEDAAVTLSLRAVAPSVRITDEALLPDAYWREKVSRSPDKALIKDDLARNLLVPGAELSNGGVALTARTK